MILKKILSTGKKKREIIKNFRYHAAYSFEMAKSLDELNIDYNTFRFDLIKLSQNGIINKIPLEKTYYLDEKKLLQYRMNRVKWGILILFLILSLIFIILPKLNR